MEERGAVGAESGAGEASSSCQVAARGTAPWSSARTKVCCPSTVRHAVLLRRGPSGSVPVLGPALPGWTDFFNPPGADGLVSGRHPYRLAN